MKITVIGIGYVGLITGLCLSEFGNQVICLDSDKEKIELLKQGQCPIYEMGAKEMLYSNCSNGRIKFTTNARMAIEEPDIIFIAVGTPECDDGTADLRYVYEVAENIGRFMNRDIVVVNKSTVPIGTARKVDKIINNALEQRKSNFKIDVVSNPEFLREGKAIGDFLNPDRIIIGTNSNRAKTYMLEVYKAFKRSNKPIMITTPETAEMIKYASNSFLATKIAFINEIAQLCEKVGANVLEVAEAMGQDGRISPKFLHPGPGYGGSCFPKDTKALTKIGVENGITLSIVESVIESNERQKVKCAEKVIKELKSGEIAILGIAFKPETDDVRYSPAMRLIDILLKSGEYTLNLYDPKAMPEGKKVLPESDKIHWHNSAYAAIESAEAVVIVTEWLEFRNLDLEKVKSFMRGNLFFDFRNIYAKKDIEKYGFKYFGVGVS